MGGAGEAHKFDFLFGYTINKTTLRYLQKHAYPTVVPYCFATLHVSETRLVATLRKSDFGSFQRLLLTIIIIIKRKRI